jgi:hypothetical protein
MREYIGSYVRFEVFTALTMKNAVFWDVAPYSSCVNRCFGGTYHLHLQGGCRRYVPPKRQFTQALHGATSQKNLFFILVIVVPAPHHKAVRLDEDQCLASCPGNFNPIPEGAADQRIGGWPRHGLDVVEKRKLCLLRGN